jgi:signal transduction histidine kinase
VFVTDQGSGFDIESITDDRKGISESIHGRMNRHGGSADIETSVGTGTEVHLTMTRGGQ